jgi:hypothetical protein
VEAVERDGLVTFLICTSPPKVYTSPGARLARESALSATIDGGYDGLFAGKPRSYELLFT